MARYVDAERGMAWVRLECAFPRNPKVLDLVERRAWRAVVVYVAGLGYSGEHGLDGFIPKAALPYLHATGREAQQLLDVGLWEWDEGGYLIHDWHDYQPTAEQARQRRDRARYAAEQRWKRERAESLRVVKHHDP